MLKRFEVKNFKNFKENFVFDLTDTKNYDFNKECVKDGVVSKGIIYGPNGCGKTNLGFAIFDIKNHLLDNQINNFYLSNYTNANSGQDIAEFYYHFSFRNDEVKYLYGKQTATKIIYEKLIVNNKVIIEFDRQVSSLATININEAQHLNNDLVNNKEISVLKYVKNNTILNEGSIKNVICELFATLEQSHNISSIVHSFSDQTIDIMSDLIIKYGFIGFQRFLKEAGVKDEITHIEVEGKKRLAVKFKSYYSDFFKVASTGTKSLAMLYSSLLLHKARKAIENFDLDYDQDNLIAQTPLLLFLDEFDAFYHFRIAKKIITELKEMNTQVILTTHNTSIMSNDLLRPDCYFVMENDEIKPTFRYTEKELRKAHNIEKLFRGGVFSNE